MSGPSSLSLSKPSTVHGLEGRSMAIPPLPCSRFLGGTNTVTAALSLVLSSRLKTCPAVNTPYVPPLSRTMTPEPGIMSCALLLFSTVPAVPMTTVNHETCSWAMAITAAAVSGPWSPRLSALSTASVYDPSNSSSLHFPGLNFISLPLLRYPHPARRVRAGAPPSVSRACYGIPTSNSSSGIFGSM